MNTWSLASFDTMTYGTPVYSTFVSGTGYEIVIRALVTDHSVAKSVPLTSATDIFAAVSHAFVPGTPLVFSGTTVPGNMTFGTTYYVAATGFTPDAFMLAASSVDLDTTIDFSSDGSGDLTARYSLNSDYVDRTFRIDQSADVPTVAFTNIVSGSNTIRPEREVTFNVADDDAVATVHVNGASTQSVTLPVNSAIFNSASH
ncbi:MAG: hypothetical protein ABIJ61_05125, partial [bacterium]